MEESVALEEDVKLSGRKSLGDLADKEEEKYDWEEETEDVVEQGPVDAVFTR